MSDWEVLGLDDDPAPGDPAQIRTLAARLLGEADLAARNTTRLRNVAANDGDLRMEGDYAPKFREVLGELPDELAKLDRAYRGCGDALTAFAGSLEEAKAKAAAALRNGRDADGAYQGALREVRSLLPPDRQAALTGRSALSETTLATATADLDESLRAQVRVAAARGRTAEDDRGRARRLADEAARLRGDAETRCERGIRSALSGIENKSWYEKAWDFVSAPFRSWDAFVDLCRNIAMVAGVVALFISGPIGLALVAIALVAGAVAFADTLGKVARGEAGLGALALDALGLIPGARGVVSVGRLANAARGAAALLRGGGGRLVGGTLRSPALFAMGKRVGSGARLPMTRDTVRQTARQAGVDLDDVTIVLNKRIRGYFGYTPPPPAGFPQSGGRLTIQFFSDAFRNSEQLVKTIAHERTHVEQIRRAGRYFDGEAERLQWERAAEAAESPAWERYLEAGGS